MVSTSPEAAGLGFSLKQFRGAKAAKRQRHFCAATTPSRPLPLPLASLSQPSTASPEIEPLIIMLYPSFLSAGAFALTANAFLIPGDLEAFTDKEVLHPAVSPYQQGQQHVILDCSSCPYALNSEHNGVHEWMSGVGSDLEMTVDSQDGALRLNEVPFYPIQTAGLPPALHVSQQKKADEASTAEAYEGDLRLSYSVEFNEQKADDSSSLITITMSVLALDGEMVKVDDLEIKAIKDVSGQV